MSSLRTSMPANPATFRPRTSAPRRQILAPATPIDTIPTHPGREPGDFITLYNTARIGVRLELNGCPIYVPDGSAQRVGPIVGAGPIVAELFYYDRSARLASRSFRLAPCRSRGGLGREAFLEFSTERILRPLVCADRDLMPWITIPPGFAGMPWTRLDDDDSYEFEQDADYEPRTGRILCPGP